MRRQRKVYTLEVQATSTYQRYKSMGPLPIWLLWMHLRVSIVQVDDHLSTFNSVVRTESAVSDFQIQASQQWWNRETECFLGFMDLVLTCRPMYGWHRLDPCCGIDCQNW